MILLKILLFGFLYLLLFLLVLLIIFLIAPLKGRLIFDVNSIDFRASYLFGLIRVKYNKSLIIKILGFNVYDKDKPHDEKIDQSDEDSETSKDDEKISKDKKKSKKKLKKPSLTVIKLTLKVLKKLIKRIAPNEFKVYLKLGIDDPYYIGMLNVITELFFMPLNRIKDYDIRLVPIFDDVVIDYYGRIQLNFSIIQLIIPTLVYLMKKPIRQYLGIFTFKKRSLSSVSSKTN